MKNLVRNTFSIQYIQKRIFFHLKIMNFIHTHKILLVFIGILLAITALIWGEFTYSENGMLPDQPTVPYVLTTK